MIVAAVGTRRLLTLTVALCGLLGALVLPISAPDTWVEPAALSVAFVLSVLLLRESRPAASLRASRSGAERAEVRGVDVTAGRFAAHLIAAVLGGVAGCGVALDIGRVAPEQFSPLRSLLLVGSVL